MIRGKEELNKGGPERRALKGKRLKSRDDVLWYMMCVVVYE